MRARFVHGQWPVVSIDPPTTRREPAYHTVRFEGGVRDTGFGLTLFEADYLLKKVGQGNVPTGVAAVPSEWALWLKQAQTQYASTEVNIGGRVWFFPILGATPVRENVAAYSGLKVGVFYEVLSATIDGRRVEDLTEIKSPTGEQFVTLVREHYDELAAMHPSWRRIKQLNELVALSRAIEVMDPRPDLSWWLESYPVARVGTPREARELSRSQTFNRGHYTQTISTEGGVELRAMALRLEAGDVSALADAALSTRSAPDALTWGFVVDDWVIAIPPDLDITKGAEVTPQFIYAQFLTRQGKYELAVQRLDKILEMEPNYLDALVMKGTLLSDYLDRQREAIKCFKAVLKKVPDSVDALVGRGWARAKTDNFFKAMDDFDKALQINPKLADALAYRGLCHEQFGEYDKAIADLTEATRLTPTQAVIYVWRGNTYRAMADLGLAPPDDAPVAPPAPDLPPPAPPDPVSVAPVDAPAPPMAAELEAPASEQSPAMEDLYEKALADFNEALRRDSSLAFAHACRGDLYRSQGQLDKALADLSEAIRLDSTGDLSYYATRASVYADLGKHAHAVADYSAILDRDPNQTEVRWERSEVYRKLRKFDKALADCQKLNLLLLVEVNTDTATLKRKEGAVGTVSRGDELQVKDVNGNWLWVEAILDNGDVVRGWIDQKQVN